MDKKESRLRRARRTRQYITSKPVLIVWLFTVRLDTSMHR